MGLDNASVTFLSAAKHIGVDFERTAMIGRQTLFPDADVLRRAFISLGIERDPAEFLRESRYGEGFFQALGAKEIASIDLSSYEDATILHDMNDPIPDNLRQRFSVVHPGEVDMSR